MNTFSLAHWRKSGGILLASAVMINGGLVLPALAASDGTLGATSTGSVEISASVPSRARLTGLSDVDFSNQDPANPASDAQDVCVWSNTATKEYTITATGSGSANAFTLTDGSATVPYAVEWADSTGATSGTALSAGTASAAFVSTAVSHNCASAPSATATLMVGMTSADLSTMSAGTDYTGTLTLLVTPL